MRAFAARALVILPLAAAAALAMRTLPRDSCTVDEFGNLPLAVAYWTPGTLHIDPGNPPLTRWIQGIPLRSHPPDLGTSRAELATLETSWDLGYRFERVHPHDYHALLVRARWASLALFLLVVLGVWAWAGALAGPAAALAAAMLTACCPNLIAHGRLVTPDIGVTAAIVAAGWAAHRAFVLPSPARAALAGLFVAAACLAKFSGLIVAPLLFAVVALAPGTFRERAARAAAFMLAWLAPLYAAYATWIPGAFHGIPTPFPASYVAGLEAQLAEAPYPAFLLGKVREGGWLSYYAVAFAVKTPLPVLALAAIAIAAVVRRRALSFALPLGMALVLFLVFGFATNKNVGIRYLLPVLPLVHVGTALLFERARLIPLALLTAAVILGLRASDAPLASFNGLERIFGGKRFVLVDSNLDWGQSLPELRAWMEREEIPVIQLAYFGRVDPSIYGIEWRTLMNEPVEGPVAISATFAMGRPYVVRWKTRPMIEPTLSWSRPDTWEWTRDLVPDEELGGGSILVWKDAAAARRRSEGQ